MKINSMATQITEESITQTSYTVTTTTLDSNNLSQQPTKAATHRLNTLVERK